MLTHKEVKAWLQASRPNSQVYLILPLIFGQAFACSYGGAQFSLESFFLSLAYSLALQLFVVFANDLADYETDKLNHNATIFSGGSRVLVNGLLRGKDLEVGACLALAMVLAISVFFTFYYSNFLILALGLCGPLLFGLTAMILLRFLIEVVENFYRHLA